MAGSLLSRGPEGRIVSATLEGMPGRQPERNCSDVALSRPRGSPALPDYTGQRGQRRNSGGRGQLSDKQQLEGYVIFRQLPASSSHHPARA